MTQDSDLSQDFSVYYIKPKQLKVPLTCLSKPAQLVLWAIRVWVRGFVQDLSIQQYTVERLNQPNGQEIFEALDSLMFSFGSASRSRLDFRYPSFPLISPDEYTVLMLIEAAQTGRQCLSRAIAKESLISPASEYAALTADQLAANLLSNGLELKLKMSNSYVDINEAKSGVIHLNQMRQEKSNIC